ncbi:ABC transporter substrate-binding protein [Paenibacillus sp. FSL H8-0548]|uniref:ABC transporter substrate-binding protein n=1 Tax=Paenibacillus sp. FSL H8-0548 TaxID=1920422 RepID=UPI0021161881|nr:ABC transporter substrate-binding protein [Paenibacillus sp. FSL H8-0548]
MKKFSVILASTMIVGLLAACGTNNTGTANNTTGNTPATATNTASGAKSTVQFWHSMGGGNGERVDAMVKRFNESHDAIEIVATFQGNYAETTTKLQQSIAAGTAPDVSMIERADVEMFADSEVLEDLTAYMEKSEVKETDFIEGLMGHSYFNDQILSLPLNRSTPIMHVNKTILDELGMEVPTTWDELKAVTNAAVKKEGNEFTRYGMSMPFDTWYPMAMFTQAGSSFFNEDRTSLAFVDDGAGEKVFRYLKDLQSTGALFYPPATDSGTIVNGMFTEGKLAVMFQSTGSIGGLLSAVDFDYVTAFLPMDEKFANPTGGANVSMLSGSANKEAAWEFIRWMMVEEDGALPFILDSGYLPVTHVMVESDAIKELWAKEPIRQTAYEQLQYAVDTNKDVAWPAIGLEFNSAIEAIMYDSEDIPATLATLKKEAERLLSE